MKLPIKSEGCISICPVRKPEKCAPGRKNNVSELENRDPGKTEEENKCLQDVGNEAAMGRRGQTMVGLLTTRYKTLTTS